MKKFIALFALAVIAVSCKEPEPAPTPTPTPTPEGLSAFPFVTVGNTSTYIVSINGAPIDSSATFETTEGADGTYLTVLTYLTIKDSGWVYEDENYLYRYAPSEDAASAARFFAANPTDGMSWMDEVEGDQVEITVMEAATQYTVPAGTYNCTHLRQITNSTDTSYTYIHAEHGLIAQTFKSLGLEVVVGLYQKNF